VARRGRPADLEPVVAPSVFLGAGVGWPFLSRPSVQSLVRWPALCLLREEQTARIPLGGRFIHSGDGVTTGVIISLDQADRSRSERSTDANDDRRLSWRGNG
jgi:hypothetical protein